MPLSPLQSPQHQPSGAICRLQPCPVQPCLPGRALPAWPQSGSSLTLSLGGGECEGRPVCECVPWEGTEEGDEKGGERMVATFLWSVGGGQMQTHEDIGPGLPRQSGVQGHGSIRGLELWSSFSHRNNAQGEVGSRPGPEEPDSANRNSLRRPFTLSALHHCVRRVGAQAGAGRPQAAKGSAGRGNWGAVEGRSYTGDTAGKQGVCVCVFRFLSTGRT